MSEQILGNRNRERIARFWHSARTMGIVAAIALSLMTPAQAAAPAENGADKGYSDMDDFQRAIVEGTNGNASATKPGSNAGQQQNRRFLDLNKNGRMDPYEKRSPPWIVRSRN